MMELDSILLMMGLGRCMVKLPELYSYESMGNFGELL